MARDKEQLLGVWNNSWHDGSLNIIYFMILISCLELEIGEIDLVWEHWGSI